MPLSWVVLRRSNSFSVVHSAVSVAFRMNASMWNDGMAQPFVSNSLQIRSMPSPNSLTYLNALAVERLTFFANQYFFYCHILLIFLLTECSSVFSRNGISGRASKRTRSLYLHWAVWLSALWSQVKAVPSWHTTCWLLQDLYLIAWLISGWSFPCQPTWPIFYLSCRPYWHIINIDKRKINIISCETCNNI